MGGCFLISLQPAPWETGCCSDWVRLKFCQRASISLVCQPCNSQPLTLPHPLVAWVSSPHGWGLAGSGVQLRDSGDSNLACDVTVSRLWLKLLQVWSQQNSNLCRFFFFFFSSSDLYLLVISVCFFSVSLKGTKCSHPSSC